MTPKVLTPEEVAEYQSQCEVGIQSLCDSHEALRAELTHLRWLIEGMEHESRCPRSPHVRLEAFGDVPKCNCIKAKVNQ